MIPVEDNWLHIKPEFYEACNNINNISFIDNLMTFRKLGLFKLLLDKKHNGLSGHPQDFLECIFAIAEQDVNIAYEFGKIGSMPFLLELFSERCADTVYQNSADEIIVKTNTESPDYADWILKEDNGEYLLGRNTKNFKPEYKQSFHDLLNPTHNNYIYKLSWFQLYNRVLVCSHLGGLQSIINVAMQHKISYALIGYASQDLDAMRLLMHRNINHALLHLKHNEEIPLFDRTKYKLQSSIVPVTVFKHINDILKVCNDDKIKMLLDNLGMLDLEHLDSNTDSVNHVEQLKGNSIPDLFI